MSRAHNSVVVMSTEYHVHNTDYRVLSSGALGAKIELNSVCSKVSDEHVSDASYV